MLYFQANRFIISKGFIEFKLMNAIDVEACRRELPHNLFSLDKKFGLHSPSIQLNFLFNLKLLKLLCCYYIRYKHMTPRRTFDTKEDNNNFDEHFYLLDLTWYYILALGYFIFILLLFQLAYPTTLVARGILT